MAKRNFGKKILALLLALMCLSTVGVVSASAKSANRKTFDSMYNSQKNSSAYNNKYNWVYYDRAPKGYSAALFNNSAKHPVERYYKKSPSNGYKQEYVERELAPGNRYWYSQTFGVKSNGKVKEIGPAHVQANTYG